MRHLLPAKGLLCLLAAGLGTLLAAERCGSGAPAAKAAGPALQPAAKYTPTPEELRLAYARAERLKARLAGRVFRDKVTPHWFDNNTKFWYRNDNRDGVPNQNTYGAHVGGGTLSFDSEGSLYIGTGDDVDPFGQGGNGYAPLDQRYPERYDARNTSANTNDLRGKILRIKPLANAAGAPGVGTLSARCTT